jgi:phenylalanyl-tRNA synthetase beta chain
MKISYKWLKDYVTINQDPKKLGDDLTMFGHKLESIEKHGDDTVLDLEITSNRGDCLSILGMAREIAALYNSELKIQNAEIKEEKLDKKINLKITDPTVCPRFTARVIDNIQITESPKWMQEKLATYGFRPINNIVDVTNYVMVATGQPLHAFDYDKIKDGLMSVRLSYENEEVMTLDGQNRILPKDAIIIEDKEKIYDLAGIMGGYKSEVDEKTKTIILQGAIFDAVLIRRASKYLSHQTDASYRYERGVDCEGTIGGVDMAASLIKKTCSDAKIGELIDIKSKKYKPTEIKFELTKINNLIGIDIDSAKAEEYLNRLSFEVKENNATVPSFRVYDVKIWQDLAEEIARLYGYNKINKIEMAKSKAENNQEWQKKEIIKDICKEVGFTEIYSYSFADKDKIEMLGFDIADCVETSNPIAPELKYLRPTLLPSILSQMAKNPWDPQIRIFELEKVFDKNGEKWQLGLAVSGKQEMYIQKVMEILKIKKAITTVDQKILDAYKIRRPVKYLIIDFDEIKYGFSEKLNYAIAQNKYKLISKFPPTVRDLSFIVAENISEDAIADCIKSISADILIVELFDVYHMDDNKKSLAFHIWLQDVKKPLADAEANQIVEQVIKGIENKYNAKIRR